MKWPDNDYFILIKYLLADYSFDGNGSIITNHLHVGYKWLNLLRQIHNGSEKVAVD